ncbi:alpha/beta hydrolase family protein [Rhodopirellula halodulae]|uniref:alpha/beta hydrolase family protein n=1 Tax=Rhodopirellula halodulae TaxID=2894198 RepID=UPI001E2C2353|nr:CocE/NonD family hydrolase [Rhodopirellula sp. JC737]MCC9658186.1 prolyl oligopeptidase family serine peptidase [Rhodopirellula sp. JC737]
MRCFRFLCALLLLPTLVGAATATAADSAPADPAPGDQVIAEYFRQQTNQLSEDCFSNIQTLEDWTENREQYRRQLLSMLGLDPMPARTELQAAITGVVRREEAGFLVEKVHFQSSPGLYVTGNLYRPIDVSEPLPAVLYVCGHGRVVKDGVSYGNKVHYQHHGAWFARNGYVCLVIDTIQLGEIEGIHHGTYREKMWWWNNRGYTPAGVEAWNCIRALDWLQSRDDVDPERLGVTGRSGGGAYSWWLAAIDERVRVAVPVAGITNLHDHVVNGCVSGHCDCMYMVNSQRWDFPMVAALVAPRPLLISNTDRDPIFPLEGVVDVHAKVRRIYDLYDASEKLGLQITSGPHQDTQELRVHAFRWFNRHLRGDDNLVESVAIKYFEPEELKVFESLPKDERVTSIHEFFVPKVSPQDLPASLKELASVTPEWKRQLKEHTFAGWPTTTDDANLEVKKTIELADANVTFAEFTSQDPFRLPLIILRPKGSEDGAAPLREGVDLRVLDQSGWEEIVGTPETNLDEWSKRLPNDRVQVLFAPRGVGPTRWSQDERDQTHIRRRFMLLGQTLAGMQIYDLMRAIQTLTKSENMMLMRTSGPLHVHGEGEAAVWALHSAVWTEGIDRLTLTDLPTTNRQGPDLLNVSRVAEMPMLVGLAMTNVDELRVEGEYKKAWADIAKSQTVLQPIIRSEP